MATVPMIDYTKHSYDVNADNEDLYTIFLQLDLDEDGFLTTEDLSNYVTAHTDAFNLNNDQRRRLLEWTAHNPYVSLNFEQFCITLTMVKRQLLKSTMLRAVQMVVPRRQRDKEFSYVAQYNCCPPPVFILLVTIAEIAIYTYYAVRGSTAVTIDGPVPIDSVLIYDPCRRKEMWRFLTYSLIHVGIWHLLTNCLVQIILGIPLEMVHKNWRIAIIYLSGIVAGSLSVSLADTRAYLAGASGGGYALMAAHLANLIINWSEMEYAFLRAGCLAILFTADLGLAVYNRYVVQHAHGHVQISYAAHLGGFIVGILLGIIVLRNLRYRRWETVILWMSVVILCFLLTFTIFWNIFNQKLLDYCH